MIASLNEFAKTADRRNHTCKLCHLVTVEMLREIQEAKGVIGALLIQRWLRSEGVEIGLSTIGRHLERCCD